MTKRLSRIVLVLVCLQLASAHLRSASTSNPTADVKTEQVRIAMLRAEPLVWELDRNFEGFLRGVSLAVEHSAQVLVTPECWLDGYASAAPDSTPLRVRGVAQDLDSSSYLKIVAEKARA